MKYIREKTGLNEKDISTIRKQLIDNGFIRYEPGKIIELDWKRIRLYSTFDKEMLPTKRGKARIAPVTKRKCVVVPREPTMREAMRKWRYSETAPIRELTASEKHFYKAVENMSLSKFHSLFGGDGSLCVFDRHLPVFTQPEPTAIKTIPAKPIPGADNELPF